MFGCILLYELMQMHTSLFQIRVGIFLSLLKTMLKSFFTLFVVYRYSDSLVCNWHGDRLSKIQYLWNYALNLKLGWNLWARAYGLPAAYGLSLNSHQV